jgi:hypothetical protein
VTQQRRRRAAPPAVKKAPVPLSHEDEELPPEAHAWAAEQLYGEFGEYPTPDGLVDLMKRESPLVPGDGESQPPLYMEAWYAVYPSNDSAPVAVEG